MRNLLCHSLRKPQSLFCRNFTHISGEPTKTVTGWRTCLGIVAGCTTATGLGYFQPFNGWVNESNFAASLPKLPYVTAFGTLFSCVPMYAIAPQAGPLGWIGGMVLFSASFSLASAVASLLRLSTSEVTAALVQAVQAAKLLPADKKDIENELQRITGKKHDIGDPGLLMQGIFLSACTRKTASGEPYITFDDFSESIRKSPKKIIEVEGLTDHEVLMQLFSIADVNHDGAVSFSDFYRAYILMSLSKKNGVILQQVLFQTLDINNDGFISADELNHFVKTLVRFGAVPAEDAVSKFGSPATAEQITSKWMARYDINRDGGVSRAEFCLMANQIDFAPVTIFGKKGYARYNSKGLEDREE